MGIVHRDRLEKKNQDAVLNSVWLFVKCRHVDDGEEYESVAYSSMDMDSIDRVALEVSDRVDEFGLSYTDSMIYDDVTELIAWSVGQGESAVDLSEYANEWDFRLFRIGIDTGEDETGVRRFYAAGPDQRVDVRCGSKIYALFDSPTTAHVGALYSVRNPDMDMMELEVE